MQDDFTIFWQNNERAYHLFCDLLDRSEAAAYDDDFLKQLAAYREESPDVVHADIFAAEYLLANGDAENAVLCAERALRRRQVELRIWQLLARAYTSLGRHADALIMQGYAAKFQNIPLVPDCPCETLTTETLNRLSIAMGRASYAPMAVSRMSYDPEEGLSSREGVFSGEFLPEQAGEYPPYYVATYTEQELQGNKAWLQNVLK